MQNPFPKLPEIEAPQDLSDQNRRVIIGAMFRGGHVTPYNSFHVDGREKWGRPENFRLTGITVTRRPVPGVEPDLTRMVLPGGQIVHVMMQTQDESFALQQAKGALKTNLCSGMILQDARNRPWLFPMSGLDLDGTGAFQINDRVSDWVAAGREVMARPPLDLKPVEPLCGQFLMAHGVIIDMQGDPIQRKRLSAMDTRRLKVTIDAAEEILGQKVLREDRIASLVEEHLNPKAMARYFDLEQIKARGKLLPDHHDVMARGQFEARIHRISMNFMQALRAEGFLAPCPNNGPRDVPEMTAWNTWLDGGFDDPDDQNPYEMAHLFQSPAFHVLFEGFVRASVKMDKRLEGQDEPLSINDISGAFFDVFLSSRKKYVEEQSPDGFLRDMRAQNDGLPTKVMGSFLTPVLGRLNAEGDLEPLEILEEQKSVMHVALDVPSQKLVMSDTFRIPGFQDGLKILMEEADHRINSDEGIDARARDMYEKTGLVIVQVGNSSPSAFEESPGIWRMGQVYEDDEIFWTKDGKRSGVMMPEASWSTCTDLSANTFGDREAVINVLMASGLYGSREAAGDELTAYIDETYGASEIDLPGSELHVYMPTGYGVHRGDFNDVFRAQEIENREWQEDAYVISTHPLTVNPKSVLEVDWVQADLMTGMERDQHSGLGM